LGSTEKQINTTKFEKGIYICQLTFNDGKKVSVKIMK